MSVNSCFFSGRLVKDADIRVVEGDKPFTSFRFTIAVDRKMSKEQREKAQEANQPTADFVPFEYNLNNENQIKYWTERLKTGQFVEVSNASYKTSKYNDKDGKTVYTQVFRVGEMNALNLAKSENTAQAQPQQTQQATQAPTQTPTQTPAPAAEPVPETITSPSDLPWMD